METISGLPKPDLTPRQTDVAYTGNRLTSIDTLWTIPPDYPTTGASFAYDNAGNIVSDGLHTDYFYNQNNRLIRVEIDGLTVAEYAYDAFERRVLKVVNGVTTHFHYDLNGLLISETDGNGNPRKDYVYLNGEPVAMKTYGGSAGWYWSIIDHLGTPQKMVDESGDVVWAAAYAPFGEARVYEDEVTNSLRFPGQYYDVETGLHYNWHRYYDPGTGRYLRADPIGLDGGINLYAYVENNPFNVIDPYGLYTWLATKFSQKAWNHVIKRHVSRKTFPGKSKFKDPTFIKKHAERTVRNFDRRTPQRNGRILYERDFGRIIGKEGESIQRVVTDKHGNLITTFPSHTFKGLIVGIVSFLNPIDAISGELDNPEADNDGNGIPDYLEKNPDLCQ